MKRDGAYVSRGRSGPDKAANFGSYVKPYGWDGKWSRDEETGVTHLFARRGENETINVWWQANGAVIQEALPMYTIAGEKIKCRNVSHAATIASREPDVDRLAKATKKQTRNLTGDKKIELTATYDFTGMADDEIEKMLLGARIGWINRLSGSVEQAQVCGRKQIKVVRNGHTQLHFIDGDGFHAVYLDSIVSVN